VLSTLHQEVSTHQLRENFTDGSIARQMRKCQHRKEASVRRDLSAGGRFKPNTSSTRKRVDSCEGRISFVQIHSLARRACIRKRVDSCAGSYRARLNSTR
jgi:hypothetical protein